MAFRFDAAPLRRLVMNGTVPPPCDQMNLMSGKRVTVPVCRTLRIARVVSITNSTPRACASVSVVCTAHAAQNGWQ
jgi:hypothetical protein